VKLSDKSGSVPEVGKAKRGEQETRTRKIGRNAKEKGNLENGKAARGGEKKDEGTLNVKCMGRKNLFGERMSQEGKTG